MVRDRRVGEDVSAEELYDAFDRTDPPHCSVEEGGFGTHLREGGSWFGDRGGGLVRKGGGWLERRGGSWLGKGGAGQGLWGNGQG